MKFLKENKKLFLTITFLSIPFFGYTLSNQIIPSQGFSFSSLFRGIIGILFLIFISYILSSNKKSINWRTATFGLILQIILAIGILKVTYIKVILRVQEKFLSNSRFRRYKIFICRTIPILH